MSKSSCNCIDWCHFKHEILTHYTSNVSWFHTQQQRQRKDRISSSFTVGKHRMHSRSPALKKVPKTKNAEYPQQEAAGEETESLQRETRYVRVVRLTELLFSLEGAREREREREQKQAIAEKSRNGRSKQQRKTKQKTSRFPPPRLTQCLLCRKKKD